MTVRDEILLGKIEPGALYTQRRFMREMRWAEHAMRQARRRGLRVVSLGRGRFVLGNDVIQFFERLAAEEQAGNGERGGRHV